MRDFKFFLSLLLGGLSSTRVFEWLFDVFVRELQWQMKEPEILEFSLTIEIIEEEEAENSVAFDSQRHNTNTNRIECVMKY